MQGCDLELTGVAQEVELSSTNSKVSGWIPSPAVYILKDLGAECWSGSIYKCSWWLCVHING